MSMTRRDYVDLARIFKSEIDEVEEQSNPAVDDHLTEDERELCTDTVKSIAVRVVRLISSRNPAFDGDRFLNDCGLGN